MTPFQIIILMLIGFVLLTTMLLILSIVKFYLTPTAGEFTIDVTGDNEFDSVYDMKFDSHPAQWIGKKYIRFKVNYKNAKKS